MPRRLQKTNIQYQKEGARDVSKKGQCGVAKKSLYLPKRKGKEVGMRRG